MKAGKTMKKVFNAMSVGFKKAIFNVVRNLDEPTREFLEKAEALFAPKPAMIPIPVRVEKPRP